MPMLKLAAVGLLTLVARYASAGGLTLISSTTITAHGKYVMSNLVAVNKNGTAFVVLDPYIAPRLATLDENLTATTSLPLPITTPTRIHLDPAGHPWLVVRSTAVIGVRASMIIGYDSDLKELKHIEIPALSGGQPNEGAADFLLEKNGDVLVAGTRHDANWKLRRWLALYDAKGNLLTDISRQGGDSSEVITALAAGENGRIFAGEGSYASKSQDAVWVARYTPSLEEDARVLIAEARYCEKPQMRLSPSINALAYAKDGTIWAVGSSCQKMFVSRIANDFKTELYFEFPSPSKGSSLVIDGRGDILVAGTKDDRVFIAKLGPSPENSLVGPRLRVIDQASFIPLGGNDTVGLSLGIKNDLWLAGSVDVEANIRSGAWIARITNANPTSGDAKTTAADDVEHWRFSDPERTREFIKSSREEARRLYEEGQRLALSSPTLAAAAYDAARDAADRAYERHDAVRYGELSARVFFKLGDCVQARDRFQKAFGEMSGISDDAIWLRMQRSLLECEERLNNHHAVWTGAGGMRNVAKRAGKPEKQKWALLQIAESGIELVNENTGSSRDLYENFTERYFLELLGMLRPGEPLPSCDLSNGVGSMALAQKDNYAAYKIFKAAIAAASDDDRCLAYARAGAGEASLALGAPAESLKLLLTAHQNALENDDANLERITSSRLARVYQAIGNYETAYALHKRSLDLAEKLKINDADEHAALAYTLLDLGDEMGAFNEASLAQTLDPNSSRNGPLLMEMMLRKGDTRTGEILMKMNVDILRSSQYYLAAKDYGNAYEWFKRVGNAGVRHGNASYLVASEIGLGRAAEGMKKYDEAVEHYKSAVDSAEMLRTQLALNDRLGALDAREWIFPRAEPFEGLARTLSHMPGRLEEAFRYSEQGRTRTLIDSLAAKQRLPPLPADLAARESALESELNYSRERYFVSSLPELPDSKNPQQDFSARDAAYSVLLSIWKKRQAFVEEVRTRAPDYAELRYPRPIESADVRLAPNETLIEYDVTDPSTKVFILKSGRIALSLDIPISRYELSMKIRRFAYAFTEVSDINDLARFEPALGLELYNMLVKPVLLARDADGRKIIEQRDRLIIVPDELLNMLPFEALPTSVPAQLTMPSSKFGPVPVGVTYFGDEADIAYQQSATALMRARRRPKNGSAQEHRTLIVADPIFGPSDSRARGFAKRLTAIGARQGTRVVKSYGLVFRTMGVGGTRSGTPKTVSPSDDPLPRLDITSTLANNLRELYADKATTLVGADASERKVLGLPLGDFRYMIFATHGIPGHGLPGVDEPALALAQLDVSSGTSGFLTASKIAALNLTADLVALPDCGTGLGFSVHGEGLMSLGRAFQLAGARNILTSLWEVSDESTVQFTESLFKNIKSGQTPRQALHSARQEIRRMGYDHPYYWAPFVLLTD